MARISFSKHIEGDPMDHLPGAVREAQLLHLDLRAHARVYHRFRLRSQVRTTIAVVLTRSTEPRSTTAVA